MLASAVKVECGSWFHHGSLHTLSIFYAHRQLLKIKRKKKDQHIRVIRAVKTTDKHWHLKVCNIMCDNFSFFWREISSQL